MRLQIVLCFVLLVYVNDILLKIISLGKPDCSQFINRLFSTFDIVVFCYVKLLFTIIDK